MILPGFSPEIYDASKLNGQGEGLPEGGVLNIGGE